MVVDPVGVWWGLKSSRDGRRPGIPVVLMGGEHGDVPLAPESGEIIADFVADPTSPSVVLDLKRFTQGEMVRFMTAFLSRLYHVNPDKSLHVVLDEADQVAPQRPMPGEQAMLGAAQRVTKLGRAKGLHPILITQRPATLSKNVLTQAGLLISHAVTGPQDRNAIDDWIKANAEEGERETFLAELSGLPRGTAYFWSPDLAPDGRQRGKDDPPLFRQVAVRDRETFDSSATPKRGEAVKPKALAEVDLEALKGRIAATIEKAKAQDPRELRKRIAELERELAKKPAAPSQRVEVEIIKPRQLLRLAAVARILERRVTATEEAARVVRNTWQEIDAALKRARALPGDPNAHAVSRVPGAPGLGVSGVGPGTRSQAPVAPAVPRGSRSTIAETAAMLTGPERKILTALAQYGTRPTRALALLTGYAAKGGGFRNTLSALRTRGHVDGRETVRITESGAAVLGAWEPLPTGQALLRYWLEHLPGPERKLLATVADAWPGSITTEALAAATGYEPSGGGFRNTLSRLRTLDLIEGRGTLLAADELFEPPVAVAP